MALPYEKIFSRVRNKINDPKELSLDEEDLLEIYIERLHSVVGNVRIRKLFSTLTLDDSSEEITWILNNTITGASDDVEEEYVIELFALAMTIEWMKPKVDDITYIGMAIGGKEEKVLNNANKLNAERLNSLETQLAKMCRNHGYLYNDYLQE